MKTKSKSYDITADTVPTAPAESVPLTVYCDNSFYPNEVDSHDPHGDIAADHEEAKRGQFAAKLDYLLSLIGYSVGLANIWRFPYLCYQNGGGAFLIPYIICLFLCGVPLFFLEVSIGQFTSRSSATMWSICPWFKGVGWATVAVSLLCSWYFNVLLGYAIFFVTQSFTTKPLDWSSCFNWWNTGECLDYNNETVAHEYSLYLEWKRNESNVTYDFFDRYSNVSWKSPSEEYFNRRVIQLSDGLHQPGGIVWDLVPCTLFAWILTFLCLVKGVQSSGKAVYFTATFPYVLLTVLLIKGATLDGAYEGVLFYISPNWEYIWKPKVWADAAFQIFFSLGPGWGGLVTMGSYNNFNNNVYRDSMWLPFAMELTSVYAGFVVFSVLGFMAKKMGVPIQHVVAEGPGLFFITYPEIVTKLPLSQLWSGLFFFMVLIIGLDTEFVMIETAITAMYDEMPVRYKKKIKRVYILAATCICLFLLGTIFVLRSGAYTLYLVDTFSSFYTLMVICLFELMAVAWIYGAERFLSDIELMIGHKPGVAWSLIWRFMTSSIVFIIFVMSILQFSSTLKYYKYFFPTWASVGLALGLVLISLLIIPAYMIYYYWQLEGSIFPQRTKSWKSFADVRCYLSEVWNLFKNKIRICNSPTPEWGPAMSATRAKWNACRRTKSYDPGLIGQFKQMKIPRPLLFCKS